MNQKKVLIAGVAGFLGSHLADSLIASGLKVVGIDDWISGDKNNISHLLAHPQFDFIETNINQKVPESLHREEWLAIVHIANTEIPHEGARLELNELLTNSFGVKNLLDLALRTKSRFVLTSTIDVYHGLASHTSLTHYYEDQSRSGVLGYSEAKRYAEALCQEYASIYGLDVRVARLSETYGPRMNLQSESLTAELIRAGLDGRSLALEEVGSRMMYVTYFSDVVYGLNKLTIRDDETLNEGIFYLVNDEAVSVLSLVLTVKEFSPQSINVEFLPKVEQSLFDLPKIDLSRSRNELYWESKVSLQDGIKKTFAHYTNMPEEPKHAVRKVVTETTTGEDVFEQSPFGVSIGKEDVPSAEDTPEMMDDTVTSTDTKSIEDVEKEVVSDLINETEESMQTPEIEAPVDAAPLSSPNGWLSLKNKAERFGLKGVSTKVPKKKRIQKVVLALVLIAILWFMAIPILGVIGDGARAWYHYSRTQKALGQADFGSAQSHLASVSDALGDSQFYWQQGKWMWIILGQEKVHEAFLTLLQSTESLSEAGSWGILFLQDTQPWWGPLARGEDNAAYSSGRTPEQLAKAQLSWRVFRQNITLAKTLADKAQVQPFPGFVSHTVQNIVTIPQQIEAITRVDDDTWEYLPQWFGYDGAQNILFLLQNNHEVRAGGGFIGSYASVHLDKGVITSLLIDDIYNPDGQLLNESPEVSPAPEAVQKYLKTNFLFLRDTNWWPDFPKTGEQFASLYDRATGVQPDWVIGITLPVIKDLLDTVGEITLPSQDTTVTADTLFEKAEIASEVDFEPGSTGKKDFLTEVAQQLWLHLFPVEQGNLASVFKIIGNSIYKGETHAYATQQSWQSHIEKSSLAGAIDTPDGDYVYTVSSNIGGNKANYWVTRSQQYTVFVDRQGGLRSNLTVSFNHQGQHESWPNGLYRDYLRVYVPKGATLDDSTGFSETVSTYDELGHTVFAGLVEVPVNSEKDVELSYTLPEHLKLSVDTPYRLTIHGQPGIEDEMFSLQLGLPLYLSADAVTVGTKQADDSLLWATTLMDTQTFDLTVSSQQ